MNIIFSHAALSWLSSLLNERFGLVFDITQQGQWLVLQLKNAQAGEIKIGPVLEVFHQSKSDFPCTFWHADKEGYVSILAKPIPAPGISELPERLIKSTDSGVCINYDILGLVYWSLSRLEEVGRKDLDSHGRFPAISSHAYKHDYLERPIVDEWLHLLGQVIKKQYSNITLKEHTFSIRVSHDVDAPSQYAFNSWGQILRTMVGHILKRKDIKAFFTTPYIKMMSQKKLLALDGFNTFDWLMDISDKNNIKSAFYFICGGNNIDYDADYKPSQPIIRKLMRHIHARGHEIGLHPSYDTYQTPEKIKQETNVLRRIMQEEGIKQEVLGGRMHYLRWQQPLTLRAWEAANMSYDSTLGYADRPGFRCGTCYEYPAFDSVEQKQLSLRIRPLVAMECSIMDKCYLGLGNERQALDKFLELKQTCQKVKGVFTLLWHNSSLNQKSEKDMYNSVLMQKIGANK